MAGTLKVNSIKNAGGATVLDLAQLSNTGRYVKTTTLQTDTTNRTSGTSWTLGPTFDVIPNCQGNSLIKLFYSVPTRNDTANWGGGYIEPQVRFNEGTWQSLGSCGHDAAVMYLGNSFIGTYRQIILIDPGLSSVFSVQFRFYFRSYTDTMGWNNGNLGHDLNAISGTAALLSGNNGLQHYAHIIVEELARYN